MTRLYHVLCVLLAVLFTAPLSAEAQPDTTRWTSELTMRYDQITETEISPDGQHVAYVVREAVMDKTTSTDRRHIHIAAVDGSSDVQYTRGEHSNWSPRWSPDGTQVAFLSTRDGRPQVYVMRLRGGEAYAVTDAETGVRQFEWAPDGRRMAYTMTDPKSKAERQREKEKRDVNRLNQEFRYAHLYTTEVKPAGDTSRSVQRLTEGEFHVAYGLDWSPSGDTIVFSHMPNPRSNSFMGLDLSTVPADSGAVESLVERPGADGFPFYGPDGEQVAFLSMGGERVWEYVADVFTVPAEGGDPTPLARTPNRNATLIGWAPKGEGLLVRDVAGTSTRVYAVPSDGDSTRAVTSDEGLYEAVSYSRSTDRLALTYQNSTTPAEVYVGSVQDFARRRLTTVNTDMPKPKMGRTELVTWTGPGGQEIEGLLTYPVGYDGGRVPLVLNVHGGPPSTHLRSFTGGWRIPYMAIFNPQVFAERGYAVLRPNPRGSDGYGQAFRLVAREDYAFRPFEDLMTGVDKALEMGVAHPDSLVVAGGSYGGYMTAWAVTHTDRFKAASMTSGISNLISHTGITDIPDHKVAMMGGEIWERSETYERYSPIYHVKNASTPTQVLHGTEDERVPPSQGREFYRALKRRGVPTEMILYPRMPHFPREPKQLVDMTTRMLDWFDEHLGRASEASNTTSSGE